jgi:GTPase
VNRQFSPERGKPVIAIAGRANVGKSTLLNRLAGKRLAITADLPGTTRDRIFAIVSWEGRELVVVDTGGWQAKPGTPLDKMVKEQVEAAVSQADAIIFLADARQGVVTSDEEIADMLRASDKPVVLAVNKMDSAQQADQLADFYRLGTGKPIAISAYHNRGIGELMDAVLAMLPPPAPSALSSEELKLAIVGRPNVGKSTLLNALLGSERAITDDAPGTTRDALDAVAYWDAKRILLIDTAGIKRRGRVGTGVDYYSSLRALQAVNRSDIALLLVDASEFITAQDMHIAGYIIGLGKGIVLLVNKWDLVPRTERQDFKRHMEQQLRFMSYAPAVYISSKLGQNINRVFPEAWRVWIERRKRLSEAEVDAVVREAMRSHVIPRKGSRRLHIAKAYQDESKPATFILQVNDPQLIHFSYERYLENRIRRQFGFHGNPLRLIFTSTASMSVEKGRQKK